MVSIWLLTAVGVLVNMGREVTGDLCSFARYDHLAFVIGGCKGRATKEMSALGKETNGDRLSVGSTATHDGERIGSVRFHHVEFYAGDAKSVAQQFGMALGMPITCQTSQATGNAVCASYGLQSHDLRFIITAPYSEATAAAVQPNDSEEDYEAPMPLPSFDCAASHDFFRRHGIAVKAVGLLVHSASLAFQQAVAGGAKPALEPTCVEACHGWRKHQQPGEDDAASTCEIAEVELYGDVVLRFVSVTPHSSPSSSPSPSTSSWLTSVGRFEQDGAHFVAPVLPHLSPIINSRPLSNFGLRTIDHAVGNVFHLGEALEYVANFTGFHEFSEFTAEDVGTVESGLNAVVLASDSELVLLALNEPTTGRRKSQIQTYLEQNNGPGLQHIALKTDDVFATVEKMCQAQEFGGGFEFMNRPSDQYYRELPERLGDRLTGEQCRRLEDLGILADADEEGVLLQIFTKPIGDRPTFFFEIIQRIGCLYSPKEEKDRQEGTSLLLGRPGCGGFGRGNFRELFKSIEEHEKTLKV